MQHVIGSKNAECEIPVVSHITVEYYVFRIVSSQTKINKLVFAVKREERERDKGINTERKKHPGFAMLRTAAGHMQPNYPDPGKQTPVHCIQTTLTDTCTAHCH